MHALTSYRPNDPTRPTVCLVHGLNSSSGGFVHMIPWLEEAGLRDRGLRLSRSTGASTSRAQRFAATGPRSAARSGDKLPGRSWRTRWGRCWRGRSSRTTPAGRATSRSLILIAPVNQGSHLAKVQTVMQLMNGLQAINGKKTSKAMLHLSDGLGQAAAGHAARQRLPEGAEPPAASPGPALPHPGRRPRLPDARRPAAQIEAQIDLVTRNSGIFGRLDPGGHRRPARPARRADRRHGRWLRRGRADPARRRRRPRDDPRQPRRADPRPPALPPTPARSPACPTSFAGSRPIRRGDRVKSTAEAGRDRGRFPPSPAIGPRVLGFGAASVNLVRRQGSIPHLDCRSRKHPMSQTVVTTKDDVSSAGARPGSSPDGPLHPVRHRDVGAVRLLHGRRGHDALPPARRVRLVEDPGDQRSGRTT